MTPSLSVFPERALADEVLELTGTGFEPGRRVTLRARTATDHGTWEARATFVSDDEGDVSPAAQAPVEGAYDGVRPMGLFQFARPVDDADVDPPTTRIDAVVDDEVVATATCERRFVADGVEFVDVDHDRLVGTLLMPPGEGPHPGVVFLGGSGGGVPLGPRASLLASRGYAVLALAYFGEPGLPGDLVEVPLAYFDAAVDWLSPRAAVRSEPLGVVGVSRGSEAAILLGARRDEVRTVVAVAPGAHAFQGLASPLPDTSAWSEDGDPTPYVPVRWNLLDTLRLAVNVLLARPNEFRDAYAGGLADADESVREAAALPVEDVGGPILLISGGDDDCWPSAAFGDRLLRRLDEADYPHEYEHLVTEDAGHAVSAAYLPVFDRQVAGDGRFRLAMGGTPEGYARADAESWPRLLATLERGLCRDLDREFATEE